MRNRIIALSILVLIVSSCVQKQPTPTGISPSQIPTSPQPTAVEIVEPAAVQPWWRSAVFYEIFVRSFYDSDSDGIGDFKGLTQKLDYLNDGDPDTQTDLGISAIWLMPVHPSPSYHGYDVVNYYAINPDYGSMDDFKNFLAEAHRRGVKVIIDLVINHTSNQHPFFLDASKSETSLYHSWYVWSDTSGGAAWYPLIFGAKTLFYYGYFCGCMPDLNYKNAEVTTQMEKVVGYWLNDVGVDGFRIDAAKHLIEEEGKTENTTGTHTWFKQFYRYYKELNPEAYVVGEVASSDAGLTAAYTGDQLDQIFNFEMASGVLNSVKGEAYSGIKGAITFTQKDMPSWNFGTFLTNHDQNRTMTVLGGSVEKAKLAAFILLTSPGTPYIYYGEEIGMTGQKPDEDIRRPMQWSSGTNAGFSTTTPWEAVHPDTIQANVEDQENSDSSLLNSYQALISLRRAHTALSTGEYLPVNSSNNGVYAFIRQDPAETLLIVINLTKNAITEYTLGGTLPSTADGSYSLLEIPSGNEGSDLTIQNHAFENFTPLENLEPYKGTIFHITKD